MLGYLIESIRKRRNKEPIAWLYVGFDFPENVGYIHADYYVTRGREVLLATPSVRDGHAKLRLITTKIKAGSLERFLSSCKRGRGLPPVTIIVKDETGHIKVGTELEMNLEPCSVLELFV